MGCCVKNSCQTERGGDNTPLEALLVEIVRNESTLWGYDSNQYLWCKLNSGLHFDCQLSWILNLAGWLLCMFPIFPVRPRWMGSGDNKQKGSEHTAMPGALLVREAWDGNDLS